MLYHIKKTSGSSSNVTYKAYSEMPQQFYPTTVLSYNNLPCLPQSDPEGTKLGRQTSSGTGKTRGLPCGELPDN